MIAALSGRAGRSVPSTLPSGEVAQLVEHTTENRSVDSSILSLATISRFTNKQFMDSAVNRWIAGVTQGSQRTSHSCRIANVSDCDRVLVER